MTRRIETLRLLPAPRGGSRGLLRAGGLVIPAALGAGGVTRFPREGDGATPAGAFRLMEAFYRPDRVRRPQTSLPVRPLRPDDGWCDAPFHRNYNRPVRLPFPASAETLWRQDRIYDIIVVMNFNIHPRRQGRGSAIFFHIARPDFAPTLGCVAIPEPEMRKVLRMCGPRTRLVVG